MKGTEAIRIFNKAIRILIMKQPLHQIYTEDPSLEAIRIIDQSIRVFIHSHSILKFLQASKNQRINTFLYIYSVHNHFNHKSGAYQTTNEKSESNQSFNQQTTKQQTTIESTHPYSVSQNYNGG